MNDCSDDKTSNLQKKFKSIKMITNKKRLGYEKNILKGFKIILKKKTDFIVTFDADGEHHVNNLFKIKKYLENNKDVDLLVGKRSSFNRLSEKIVSNLFEMKLGIKDPLSGLKAYNSISLKKSIPFIKCDYFLTDIITSFYKMKKNIRNINIRSIKVHNRKSKVGLSLYANFKILRSIKLLFDK